MEDCGSSSGADEGRTECRRRSRPRRGARAREARALSKALRGVHADEQSAPGAHRIVNLAVEMPAWSWAEPVLLSGRGEMARTALWVGDGAEVWPKISTTRNGQTRYPAGPSRRPGRC